MAKKPKTDRGETVTQLPATEASGLLAAAVQATQTGSPCFASMTDIAPLLNHPSGQLVEYNDAMTDGNGRIALRATAIGVQVFQMNGTAPNQVPVHVPFPAAQTAFPNGGNHEPAAFPLASGPVVGSHTATTPRPVFKKGIPIPPPRARRESTKKYAFDEMEVGDCFDTLPAGDSPEPWKKLASASSAASKRFAPKKFETWPIEDGGVKFARTWRTA